MISFIPGLELWHVWLIVAIVLIIAEVFTAGFGLACFAVGALLSALVAAVGLNIYWQLGAFALASVLSFFFVRPFVLRYLEPKNVQKTNLDNFVGRQVRVAEEVSAKGGLVKLDGVEWSAVARDADAVYAAGEQVAIVARQGNTLIVAS